MIEGPYELAGHQVWSSSKGGVEVRFVGKGPEPKADRAAVLAAIAAIATGAPALAWPRQVHSSRVLVPRAGGECGEGDAVVAGPAGPALCVVTADCVPVVLAGPEGIAAVHAGWRGLVSGVIGEAAATAVRELGADLAGWTAWIGPAIGPCCYEVGPEVAEQVATASGAPVAKPGPSGRPHLDLHAAARRQLARAGVGEIHAVPACTRCEVERLWSYRREGKAAGRNLALVWCG
jgi:YfiH family protein